MTKDLFKQFLKYLGPSVAAMWVFSLYTIVDGIFVSKSVGELALASVNIAMPFIGCGLNRLEWCKVSEIIKEVFEYTDVEILVCKQK